MHILFKGSQNIRQNDHILGHEISLNKFKVIKIINSTFSDHNRIRLEISNRKLTGKPPNTGKLNRTLLNDPWVREEVSRENLKGHLAQLQHMKLWDTAKTMLRGKLVALKALIRKEERWKAVWSSIKKIKKHIIQQFSSWVFTQKKQKH